MKHIAQQVSFKFALTVCCWFHPHAHGEANETPSMVADRLVLELDRAVFSQRNVESYILVKHAVFTNGTVREISNANWLQLRDEFLNDMIVDREASRLGSFRVNPQIMQRSMTSIEKMREQNPGFKQSLERLQLGMQQIQQQISSALRIEAYKRGKLPDRNADLNVLTFVDNEVLAREQWFDKLRRALIFRWFGGTDQYKKIAYRE